MSDDSDLRTLLRSPALALDPAPGLTDLVRGRARRTTRRRRGAFAAAGLASVAGALLLGPAVVDAVEELTNRPNPVAGVSPDPRFPSATSDVVTMRLLNGAQLVTWYEGSTWCTAVTRVTITRSCTGPVNARAKGLPGYLGPASKSLAVDRNRVVAGLVGEGIVRVKVVLEDGPEFEAQIVEGRGFARPVWSALLVGNPSPVKEIAGFGSDGREVVRVPV